MKKTLPLLILFLLLGGCGEAIELSTCRNLADEFMEKFTKGDYRGAYELCDTDTLNYEDLTHIANSGNYDELLNDYRGLEHGEGGQKSENQGIEEVRLAPAAAIGHDDFKVHFKFQKMRGEWKIIGFAIEKD